MAINLIAAHSVRFTIRARDSRLWYGLAVLSLGGLITWGVIVGGSGDSLGASGFLTWGGLWILCKIALIGLCFAAGWGVTKIDRQRKLERTSVMIIAVALSVFTGWLWYQGSSVALGDSSMRILWQLLQGGFAGIVLLAGCCMVESVC